jgi:hypothetical protein
MFDSIFLLLLLLMVKHTICDYYLQSLYHISNKGTYGAWGGVLHSLHHAIGTAVVMYIVLESIPAGILFGLFDGLVHYHIDYIKTRFGPRDIAHPNYWRWFGCDQCAHMLTYIFMVWFIF